MAQINRRTYSATIAQQLTDVGIAPLLSRIYAARGICDVTQLNTSLKHLLPFTQLKKCAGHGMYFG